MHKVINILYLTVFSFKHLSQAITMTILGFKLPYLVIIFLITIIFNMKYFLKKLIITKKQLYIIILTIFFYLLIINNLEFNTLFRERSLNMLLNGFFYLLIPFLVLFIDEYPEEQIIKKIIKFVLIVFIIFVIYKIYIFNEEYPLQSPYLLSNFYNYFSFYKMPSEIIELDALRTESIRSGRLVGIFLLYALLLVDFSKIYKIFLLVFLVILMMLIGNRGSVLTTLFILFIFVDKKMMFFWIGITAYISLLIILNNEEIFNILQETLLSGKFQSLDSTERTDIWLAALDNINHVSFFGNGIDGVYKIIVPGLGHVDYPHNIGLEILYKFGVFGFLIYLLMIYMIIKKFFQYNQFTLIEKFLYISTLFYLLVAQVSGDIYMNIHLFSFSILFFLLHYKNKSHAFKFIQYNSIKLK